MKTLQLDALRVETFATGSAFGAAGYSDLTVITQGIECSRTVDLTCDTCRCNTPRHNCA